jgi:organic radical activating enzyme
MQTHKKYSHPDDLAKDSTICIYGAGESGLRVLEWFAAIRPDVTVKCFLDTFKSGESWGLPCIKIDDFDSISNEIDMIVIASVFSGAIAATLDKLGIANWRVIDPLYYHYKKPMHNDIDQSLSKQDMYAQIKDKINKKINHRINIAGYLASQNKEYELLLANQGMDFLPWRIMVQLSKKCNLRCAFCGHKVWKSNSGFMDVALFERIIEQLLIHNVKCITLVGPQGEPTLHPQLDDILNIASQSGLDVTFCTNGTALTGKHIDCLVNGNIKNIAVSFAGYDKASYERLYIGSSFEKVVHNIKMLSDEIIRSGKDIKFDICGIFIPADKSEETFEEFQSKCHQFYDELGLCGTQGVSDKPHNFAGIMKSGKYSQEKQIWSSYDLSGKYLSLCAMVFNPGFYSDGLVTACGCHDANGEMIIGDIRKNTLFEIMNSQALAEIIDKFLRRDIADMKLCGKCDFPYKNL